METPPAAKDAQDAIVLEDVDDGIILVSRPSSDPSLTAAEPAESATHHSDGKNGDVEQVVSAQPKTADTTRPVDGGFGWVIVAASFMVHVVAIGLPATFGVFNSAYKEVPELAGSSTLAIAFIGSLANAGLPLFSIPAGRLTDKFGPTTVCLGGAAIMTASLIAASFSQNIWHLLITHGFLFGVGTSFAYIPGLTVVADWFDKRRGIATGIAVAGSGLGGLALSPILRTMISQMGWRATLRIMGIGGGAILVCCAFVLRSRTVRVSGKAIDLSLFKDSTFLRLYAIGVINSFAYFIPFFYVPSYALKYGMTSEQGALLIGLLNGASGFGRVFLGFLADYFGHVNALTLCLIIATSSLLFVWPFATAFGSLLVFVLMFGFFVGGFISLMPTVISQLFGHKGNLATVTGMVYNAFLFGNLFGAPIAGAMIDHFTTYTPSGAKVVDFLPAILFAGACFVCGSGFMLSIKYTAGRRRFMAKI
ncbi:major facilitator superfamily domain-containing protein [Entophlyctis helioformis]|nr:major facilitator superfamily domain-containing protein [Entophlyctis helioformis]